MKVYLKIIMGEYLILFSKRFCKFVETINILKNLSL